MSEYFSNPNSVGANVKVELNVFNYVTKRDLKNATNLNNLTIKVDKSDFDKLVPVPDDLNKVSDAVKHNAVNKGICNAKIKYIEDRIPDSTNLGTDTTLNANINEIIGQIRSITKFAATTALTAVENKIRNVSNLVIKLTITQRLRKLKRELLTIIMINIILLQYLSN